MSLLEYLRKAAKSNTSVYITFLQQYNNHDGSIHIFHEGKDDPSFYGNFIHHNLEEAKKVYYYQAKNKDKVYDNHQMINWNAYSKKRVLFFVDKDLSDFLEKKYVEDNNIFVTSHYSIENYLVSPAMFSRSLREIVGLDNDVINNTITSKFISGLKAFYESSLLLSAYIIYHRRKNNSLNLKNLSLNDFISINEIFEVKRKQNILDNLDRITGVSGTIIFRELRAIIEELKRIPDPKKYVRGKFEIAYMVSCINRAPDIINYDKKQGEKRYKCCVLMSLSNCVPILAPRINPPGDFMNFLASNN